MVTTKFTLLAIVLGGLIAAGGPAQAEQTARSAPTADGAGLLFQFGMAKGLGGWTHRSETYLVSWDLGYLGRITDGRQSGWALQLAAGDDVREDGPLGLRYIYRRVFGRRARFYTELSPGLYLSALSATSGERYPAWFCNAEVGHRGWLAVSLRYDRHRFDQGSGDGVSFGRWSLGAKVQGWKGLVAVVALVAIAAASWDGMSGMDFSSGG
jgi:hypothetical protein